MTPTTKLTTRSIGKNGLLVSALGLGCMGMSEFYGQGSDEALNTIAAALDAGVSLFDTGDFYGMGGDVRRKFYSRFLGRKPSPQ